MDRSTMVLSKMFSAQWFMAVVYTLGATLLAFLGIYICYKAKNMEAGIAITMFYLNIAKDIATSYFNRDRSNEPKMDSKPVEVKPSV